MCVCDLSVRECECVFIACRASECECALLLCFVVCVCIGIRASLQPRCVFSCLLLLSYYIRASLQGLCKKERRKEEEERKKKVEWKERKRAGQQNETHAAGTAQSAAADAPRANPLRQPGASARGPKVENRTHPKNRLQPPRRLQRARQRREMMQQRRDQRRRYGQCLAQQGQEVEEGEEAEKEELCG